MTFRPFNDQSNYDFFNSLLNEVVFELRSMDNERILRASPTEMEDYYLKKVLIEPIILDVDGYYIEDQKSLNKRMAQDFGRGDYLAKCTELKIAVPFTGDKRLWRIQPSTRSLSGYPEIEVQNFNVIVKHTFIDDRADSESIRNQISRDVSSLNSAIQILKSDVTKHNEKASLTIATEFSDKKIKAQRTLNAIGELGIPIKKRSEPLTFTETTKRRSSPLIPPRISTEKFELEPALDEKEFEHIIKVMKSMSLVIERSPKSFSTLNEEAIRTHFLLQLNGHYEGSATGETFNAAGKTDILIRSGNKNIFIAECKFWHGPKSFNDAIDQLLSYLTWRDSKCALLIFNKNKDTNSIREKMHEIITERNEYRKTVQHNPNDYSRYVFVKQTDPGKEIFICTMIFDFPVEEN